MNIATVPTEILIAHLLLYPVYQIVGTLRHEGAHAIAAIISGFEIVQFRFWPSKVDGVFYWGFVRWRARMPYEFGYPPRASRHVFLAPYYVDLVFIVAGAVVLAAVEISEPHVYMVALVSLIISPIMDCIYNIAKARWLGRGDFVEARKLGR